MRRRSTAITVECRTPTRTHFEIVPALPSVIASFELGRRLGGGGMGVVYEARHVFLDRRVALKLSDTTMGNPELARARLRREAQALARVRHPNVVTLFELGEASGCIFIAMELLDRGTLADWIAQPVHWCQVIDMFLALGAGLVAVHELGLVHRDVKPSNVLLDRFDTPKLADFGLAGFDPPGDLKLAHDEQHPTRFDQLKLTDAGTTLGTPAYMAPEQASGGRVDARADQFAFCMSLHEALTGVLPGEREPRRAVPRPLRSILARGLALEPAARFPTMAGLLAALAHARR